MSFKPITVSQLAGYLKQIFDAEELLHGIAVCGEISDWSSVRGTAYFTLKDSSSAIPCVCFSIGDSDFKNGDSVMAIGSVKYYTKGGKLNFNVFKIEPYGESVFYKQYLELKQALLEKGYFDESNKKPIPKDIKRIGVVSSAEGAVIQDIINVRTRRNPSIDIVLYPVRVQGDGAEQEIARGIEVLDGYNVDAIIVARGGGSFEDLMPFNTEIVANATYNCKKFIMSAVGHETDYTIIDFCSDMRAPTPSAAAELICSDLFGDRNYFYKQFSRLFIVFDKYMKQKEENYQSDLTSLLNNYNDLFNERENEYNSYLTRIYSLTNRFLDAPQKKLELTAKLLDKLNPNEVLKLGYSVVKSGYGHVCSVDEVFLGQSIDVVMKDGLINTTITGVKKYEL